MAGNHSQFLVKVPSVGEFKRFSPLLAGPHPTATCRWCLQLPGRVSRQGSANTLAGSSRAAVFHPGRREALSGKANACSTFPSLTVALGSPD